MLGCASSCVMGMSGLNHVIAILNDAFLIVDTLCVDILKVYQRLSLGQVPSEMDWITHAICILSNICVHMLISKRGIKVMLTKCLMVASR